MFLSHVLPTAGLYCVAIAAGKGFRHRFFDNLEKAYNFALQQDAEGETVYVAQATYSEHAREANLHNRGLQGGSKNPDWQKERSKGNTVALRSFFLDIDCGAGKPYPDQTHGAKALATAVAKANLPAPVVVRSGNGLYAYWPMVEDVPVGQWETIARVLKDVMVAVGFEADPAPTANCAAVLRPPGTHNRKPGCKSPEVTVISKLKQYNIKEFATALGMAAKKYQVKQPAKVAAPKDTNPWEDFQVYQDVPSSALAIEKKCAQVRAFAAVKGHVDEPMWYAMIGLLRFTTEGEKIIHEWSSGHPDYSVSETDRKIQQHIASGAGPTTCGHIGALCPEQCMGCKSKDKISTPLILGRPEPVAATDVTEEDCDAPEPFIVADDGLYVRDGETHFRFYDRQLIPIKVSFDVSVGCEVTTLKHNLPHGGWHEFSIKTALVHDQKSLLSKLADNHVLVIGKKEKSIMGGYLESYVQRLQRKRAIGKLLGQMGWTISREQDAFVLGKKIYYADGSIDVATVANNVPAVTEAYHTKGDLSKWAELTSLLDKPGAEGFAFALMAGGFGAPLMKFTGYEGAMVSLVGKSGIGKTLMTRWIQSVYGEERSLMMLRDDTRNSLISRLGIYGSLPMTIDEITNIDPNELSDLVYRITQGRDKTRLSKDSVERTSAQRWNTIAVVSSNSSLVDKLSSLKSDASAEMNRVFEYSVTAHPELTREVCTGIYRTITDNYGHAGEVYIKEITTKVSEHRANIDKLVAFIEAKTKTSGEDRFWCAVVAAAVYGGGIARRLGLLHIDTSRVLKWAIENMVSMSVDRSENVIDSVGLLAQFLDENIRNALVVRIDKDHKGGREIHILQSPVGKLEYRFEQNMDRLYISRAAIRTHIQKGYGNYRTVTNELTSLGVLINANQKRVLGQGTPFASGKQDCWVINTARPELGHVAMVLADNLTLIRELEAVRS